MTSGKDGFDGFECPDAFGVFKLVDRPFALCSFNFANCMRTSLNDTLPPATLAVSGFVRLWEESLLDGREF